MKFSFKHTIKASYFAYITLAIVNNYVPLLFLTFENSYGISMGKITLLIIINFGTQLIVDYFAAKYVDKIGYRKSIVFAHIFAGLGLISLGVLPHILPSPYIGFVVSVMIYAIGGGLIEVLVSPIVEACPTDEKSSSMSLLHSFYCWGHVLVILLSTLLFSLFGIKNWMFIAIIWAIVPIANALYFSKVPLYALVNTGESLDVKSLVKRKFFWLLVILMLCSGAAEQAMSQWSSAFAESGLNFSKTVGDIAGPCVFAILMGVARVSYSLISKKIKLKKIMMLSAILCIICYLIATLSPNPVIALIGCALCGFSVGIFWPGTLSLASEKYPSGGTAMFGLLALGGDVGCFAGPSVVGLISGANDNNLKFGLLFGVIFPLILLLGLFAIRSATTVSQRSKV